MAQSSGRRFYLAGSVVSIGGSDYRGVDEADPGTGGPNTLQTISWAASEAQSENYIDPGTARVNPADEDPFTLYGFGWSINRAKTNRDESGAYCRIPAGTWDFSIHLHASVVQTNNATQLYVACWKVAEDNSKTLLFVSTPPAGVNIGLTGTGGTTITSQKTGVAEIILNGPNPTAGECLAFEFFISSRGPAVTGLTLTAYYSHSDSWVSTPDPGLRTRFPRSFAVTGIGGATIVKATAPVAKLVTAVGVAAYAKVLTLARAFTVAAVGVVSIVKQARPNPMSVQMVGVATLSRALTLARAFTATMVGVPSVIKRTIPNTFTTIMVGVAGFARSVVAARAFTVTAVGVASITKRVIPNAKLVTMTGVAAFSRALILARSFLATMVGVPTIVKRTIPNALAAIMVGVASFSRAVLAARAFTVQAVGVASTSTVALFRRAFTVVATGVASIVKRTTPNPKSVTMVGVASIIKRTTPGAYTAVMVGVAGFERALLLARSFAVQMVGVAGFSRIVTSVRMFTTAMIGVVRGRVEMSFDVLNRIVAGGTTIIKRMITIFDD